MQVNININTRKAYGGMQVYRLSFVTSSLDDVIFTFRPLYPGEGAPVIHWIGGWVGAGRTLKVMEEMEMSFPISE
jgi:hypothetical protein